MTSSHLLYHFRKFNSLVRIFPFIISLPCGPFSSFFVGCPISVPYLGVASFFNISHLFLFLVDRCSSLTRREQSGWTRWVSFGSCAFCKDLYIDASIGCPPPQILGQFWPFVGDYVKDLILESIEPSVRSSLPAYLHSFKFERIDLGDVVCALTARSRRASFLGCICTCKCQMS